MRYFFHIAYKGTNFHGWQRQEAVPTIQETVEDALSKILKRRVVCIGCGRTDAGVHASQYFFHLDVSEEWSIDLKFVLNKTLPNDISVLDISPVQGREHAQYGVSTRTYTYLVHTREDPFLSEISALYPVEAFRFDEIRKALTLIPEYRDFRGLCKVPGRHDSTLCQVSRANLFVTPDKQRLQFQFTADRFLQGMVRILVGNLLEVGRGKLRVPRFERYLQGVEKPEFLLRAYPQGLYLSEVRYPFFTLPPKVKPGGGIPQAGQAEAKGQLV